MLTKILPWHKIGLPESQAETLPELQEYYGDAWPTFAKYYLPTQRLISTISCPKLGGPGCPRQVIVHSYNDIVAVCGNSPKECESVEIFRRDAIIYELKVEKLLSDFAQLFNVKGTTPENIMPLTWNLGTYAADDLPGMSVYLSLQSDAQELQFVVITLLAQKEKPFILLVPSRNSCPVSILTTIDSAEVYLIALDEIIIEQNLLLSVSGSLSGFISAKPSAVPTKTETKEQNIFRKEGQMWTLRYSGVAKHFNHSKGLLYISYLLGSPFQEFHVAEVVRAAENPEKEVLSFSSGEVSTKKTIANYRKRLSGIRAELSDAVEKGDPLLKKELLEEKDGLEKQLLQAVA